VKRSIRHAAAAVLVAFPLAAAAGELRVTVEGIRSARGTVLIGLYVRNPDQGGQRVRSKVGSESDLSWAAIPAKVGTRPG
jgi:uncharacterized protein (DUF2141 family)